MKSQLRTPQPLLPLASLRAAASDNPKRWPWALAALMLIAALVSFFWTSLSAPSSLDDVALVGERSPGCMRVVVASDQSGSMTEFSAPREQALGQFLQWAPDNLRSDDEIVVLSFTDYIQMVVDPVAVTARPAVGSLAMGGTDTLIQPVISGIAQLPPTTCRVELILLSDGLVSDLESDSERARVQLRDAGITDVFLLVPGENIELDAAWEQTYPYAKPTRFDGTDPAETGLVFGEVMATVTGQHLEKKNN